MWYKKNIKVQVQIPKNTSKQHSCYRKVNFYIKLLKQTSVIFHLNITNELERMHAYQRVSFQFAVFMSEMHPLLGPSCYFDIEVLNLGRNIVFCFTFLPR